ncbi:MAG: MFS transporter, partial [Actinobacteria bacterium]|nr:MFS transporter [Actinomycetota bacterium]
MFKVLRTNRDIRLLFIGDNISIIGFISPIAGPIIDRFDRKKVLITVHLLQAVSAVGFLFTSKDRIWVGLVAQVLITCLSAFVTPAVNAAVPNLAKDPEELRQAN